MKEQVAGWEVEHVLMINPNGPLVECGSDGDNGQTGRKLVMDYYGPRVTIAALILCSGGVMYDNAECSDLG